MAQSDYSEQNVANSIATFLATKIVTAGYLIYWYEQDAVETADGWYPEYSTKSATYLADATFAGRVDDAKGILTLKGRLTANPVFVTRHSSRGTFDGAEAIPIPAFAVEVAQAVAVANLEFGTSLKWRVRHLLLFGFARTVGEQSVFADLFAEWFDAETRIDVTDHAGGTGNTVGDVRVREPSVDISTVIDGPEAQTYVVELNARLEYVA